MTIKLFITGTDTNVGKTYISIGILKAANQINLSTLGMKPVASGCFHKQNELYNQDAVALRESSSVTLDYQKINPFAFEPYIAPHIAANQVSCELTVEKLMQTSLYARQYPVDVCLMEGVGGWNVPLNNEETMSDFVKNIDFKVILVVGIRLGCLNHAILTYEAIKRDNVAVLGWIGNCLDSQMTAQKENIATLRHWLRDPCLGVVNYRETPEKVVDMNQIIYSSL
jgi:dethiobiotin synthetase